MQANLLEINDLGKTFKGAGVENKSQFSTTSSGENIAYNKLLGHQDGIIADIVRREGMVGGGDEPAAGCRLVWDMHHRAGTQASIQAGRQAAKGGRSVAALRTQGWLVVCGCSAAGDQGVREGRAEEGAALRPGEGKQQQQHDHTAHPCMPPVLAHWMMKVVSRCGR